MSELEGFGPLRDGIVGLLDIGTSKVCCLIVRRGPPARGGEAGSAGHRVLGLGHHRSRGIKAGVILDMDEVEQSVRAAVAQAERMAGVTLQHAFLAVSAGRLKSRHFTASAEIERGIVADEDLLRLMQAAQDYAARDGRLALQIVRLGLRLDGHGGLQEVRGLAGRRLAAEVHAVTADEAPLRHLAMVAERCHLSPIGLAPAGLASALATTSEDERRIGVVVIDVGGGTTSIAAFVDGQFLLTDTIPVGGNHVTYDIARDLQTTLAEAERIKALYGTVVQAMSDEREVFSYPLAGTGGEGEELELHQASKAQVRQIVQPRMDVILGLAHERISAFAGSRLTRCRVVLTGGASQLTGLGEFAANRMGVPVKIGRPAAWGGVPASVCTPAYATVLGLLEAASRQELTTQSLKDRDILGAGYLGRMGRWLKESF